MATIMDYVRGELAPFGEKPLCEVDSLVFSQLAMVRMDGIAPEHPRRMRWGDRARRAARNVPGILGVPGLGRLVRARRPQGCRFADLLKVERFDGMFTGLAPDAVKELLMAAAASPRFRDIVIHDYLSVFSERRRMQFAAVAFSCPGRFSYLAFRGTDSSWVGWREDFDMAYAAPVPAQAAAQRYASEVAGLVDCPLVLGGHSKGGNLAVYAAAKLPARDRGRIWAVYDHDGPGFAESALSEEELSGVRGLVRKTVPEESLVGMLMASPAGFRVVKSAGHGIDQHSVFRWQVEDGTLVGAEGLAPAARITSEILNEWIAELGPVERQRAVDALFEALRASGASDMFEVLSAGPKALGMLVEAARRTSPGSRDVIMSHMKRLSGIAARKVGAAAGALFSRE